MAHAPAHFLGPHPLGPWGGVKNLIFWTWSCGISNLRGWAVDQDTLKNFNLWSNWWPWYGVKGSITIRFLWEREDLRWYAIECVLVYPFYVSGAYLLYYKYISSKVSYARPNPFGAFITLLYFFYWPNLITRRFAPKTSPPLVVSPLFIFNLGGFTPIP